MWVSPRWHNQFAFGNLASEQSWTLSGQCPQTLKTLSMDLLLHFSMYKGNAGRLSFTAKILIPAQRQLQLRGFAAALHIKSQSLCIPFRQA